MSSNGLKELKDDLAKLEIKIKKNLGQNFCFDNAVIDRIVSVCAISPSDWVVEIGAGTGFLTSSLALFAHHVTAVEIDTDLRQLLIKNTGLLPNVKLVFGDALEMNIASLKPTMIVGNLPYYCASAIIRRCSIQVPDVPLFFMLPEDVVSHLNAKPGTHQYTAFSVFVQYAFTCNKLFEVHPSSFYPRPNVGSAFVSLEPPKVPRMTKAEEDHFIRVVEGAFMQRRKMMVNSLIEAGFDEEEVQNAMSFLGLPKTVRGETLNVEQFKRLAGFVPS